MSATKRVLLIAALLPALAAPPALAGNGAIERPAPTNAAIAGRPVLPRPGYDLAATLNEIIADQLAVQGQTQADQSNPMKRPRPRPDREYMVDTTGSAG